MILALVAAGALFYGAVIGSFWDGLFVLISALLLTVWAMAWWSIFQKAGYQGKNSLLMFIPIVNLVVIFVLAFKEWPLEKRVREQEQDLVQGIRKKF